MNTVYEHNPGDHEDPQTGSTWIIGAVGTIILIVIVFGLTALLYQATDERITAEVIDKPYQESLSLKKQQTAMLVESGLATRPAADGTPVKVEVIPIKNAMQIVANEASQAKNPSPR